MGNLPRNTATRDRHRRVIRSRNEPCAICGCPIDYSLPYLHPMEFVVDHVIPHARGGPDTLANKQPAHRSCNRTKSDKTDGSTSHTTTILKSIKRLRAY